MVYMFTSINFNITYSKEFIEKSPLAFSSRSAATDKIFIHFSFNFFSPTSGEEIVSSSQSCTLCPAQFSSSRELVQHHKEAHPGEMPWECDICSKRYHKKVAMKAHMRVHNAMARYQCSTCKK